MRASRTRKKRGLHEQESGVASIIVNMPLFPTARPDVPVAAPATVPPPPTTSSLFSRDVVRSLMNRVLALAVEELSKEDTRRHIRDHLVHPVVRLAYEQVMPYLLVATTIIIAILLMSMLSLALSSMFYFKKLNLR